MAKAKVLDDKVVIKSDILTDENLRKVLLLNPSALKLVDENSNNTLYEVTGGACNSFTQYGAVFAKGESKANIEIVNVDDEEAKLVLKELVTGNLIRINAIEEQVEGFLDNSTFDDVAEDVEFLN